MHSLGLATVPLICNDKSLSACETNEGELVNNDHWSTAFDTYSITESEGSLGGCIHNIWSVNKAFCIYRQNIPGNSPINKTAHIRLRVWGFP